MWSNKVTLLFLLSLIVGSLAQLLPNPVRVYNNPTDGTVIKAIGAAMTTCSVTLVILDSSSQCMKYANQDGEVYDWACTPNMATSFDMFIYASAGYTMNSDGKIVILDMYTGDEIDVIGQQQIKAVKPVRIGLYTSYAVPTVDHTWVLADGVYNSTIWLPKWSGPTNGINTYSSQLIVQLNNTVPILSIVSPGGSVFGLTYENSNEMHIYSWTAATASPAQKYLRTLRIFDGEIKCVGADFYGRIWAYDAGCGCIKVFDQYGTIVFRTQIPEATNPRSIQVTRNKVFILDDFGVLRYDLQTLTAVVTPPTNPTCASSSLRVTVSNGAGAYNVRLIPDQVSATAGNALSYTYSTTITPRTLYTTPFTLYNDAIAPEFEARPTTGVSDTASTDVPAYEGANSWKILLARGYQYGIRASSLIPGSTISANTFSTLELMVYLTSAVEKFRIDLSSGSSWFYFDYNAAAFPVNTWTKISIDISTGPLASYPNLVILDLSKSESTEAFLYVDNIKLIPYPTTDRFVTVRDYCNATFRTPMFPLSGESVLKASISAERDTCTGEAEWTSGTVRAVVSGGVAPYRYNWTFTKNTNSSIPNVQSLGSSFILYESELHGDFKDASYGNVNLQDTTNFRTAPHSASITPNGLESIFTFFTPQKLSSTLYQSVEFWVNGGSVGGQLLYVGLVSPTFTTLVPTLAHRLLSLPSLPPNTWLKVTLTIPASAGVFHGLVFYGVEGLAQPKIYIDDIKFVKNDFILGVTDAANCYVSTTSLDIKPCTPPTLPPTSAPTPAPTPAPTCSASVTLLRRGNPWSSNGQNYQTFDVEITNTGPKKIKAMNIKLEIGQTTFNQKWNLEQVNNNNNNNNVFAIPTWYQGFAVGGSSKDAGFILGGSGSLSPSVSIASISC